MYKMVSKVLLTLALLVAVIEAGPMCKNRGKRCNEDVECACPGGSMICSWRKVCAEMDFLDKMQRSKPCYGVVFKRRCFSDSDCSCPEGKLVCEDNECVQPRRTLIA